MGDLDLERCRSRLLALRNKPPLPLSNGKWTVAQQLRHLALAINGSLRGYPQHKGACIAALLRCLVLRGWIRKGRMTHDRYAGIPGIDEPIDCPLPEAVDELVAAIDRVLAHDGELQPHFVRMALTFRRSVRPAAT